MRRLFSRTIVSLSVKVCRYCHRIQPPDILVCPGCGKFDLVAVRCRVDRQDLEEFYKAFPTHERKR